MTYSSSFAEVLVSDYNLRLPLLFDARLGTNN